MPAKARLEDIVDALEMHLEESSLYFDPDTGEVLAVANDILRKAEDGEEPDIRHDWQKQEWATATRIVSTDRCIPLPSNFDVNEWEIMESFCFTVKSDQRRQDLLDAIHGSGAFRRFKNTIRRLRIEDAWYAFREGTLKDIAREWCEENEIECE
jgi:hypothetical protein